jgi:hypothetical protein
MWKKTCLVTVASVALFGCPKKGGTDFVTGAEEASDSSDVADAEGNLLAVHLDGAEAAKPSPESTLTADLVAQHVQAHVGTRLTPSTCVTSQLDDATATLTIMYDDCTGPYGLVHVTGTLTLAFTVDASGTIGAHASGTGIMLNSVTVDVDADATYTPGMLTVSARGGGTGRYGHTFTHTGDYTLTWDSATQCHTLDGNWSTTFDDNMTRTLDVTNLSRCAQSCPSSGTVVFTGFYGATLTINFDGTAVATWDSVSATDRQSSGTINLVCTPAIH